MSPKTIKLYEQHVREKRPNVLRLVRKEPSMQAVSMPAIPQTIALVDFSNLLVRNYKAMANDAGPNDAGQMTLNQLSEVQQMCETVVVCMDCPPYERKQIYPDYKGKRERDTELEVIRAWTVERLKKDGYQIARSPGQEADDVIATLAREYADEGCPDIRILGNDKDACQLINDSVRVFVPKGRGEYEMRDAAWVKQKYGVEPRDMALFQAICGDKSDGIPGIAGIGDKGAAKLITAYKNPAGMAEACARAVDESQKPGAKPLPAFWRNYAAGMASLPRWIQLTTLNASAVLEKLPLDYLERLPVQQLVQEDGTNDAEDSGLLDGAPVDEVDWEFIAEQTSAKEREELAKALPVGPPLAHGASKMVIGKDPKADEALRALGASKPAASSSDSPSSTPSNGAAPAAPAQTTSPATAAAHSGAGAASHRSPATPPADATSSSYQPSNHNGAAQLVPATQGPAPRKLQDEITSTAVVRVDPPSWSMATQPCSANEMLQIAKVYMNSRFYSQYGTPQGVFAVCQLGRELGLGVAASVESFHIVQGRPFPKATTLKSLAEKHPDCEWIMVTSADDKPATIKTKHRMIPEVLEYTYTIERAQKAGYLDGQNKHNWLTKTQEMLEARTTSKAVRRWYPGAILGLHSEDEARDFD